MGIYISAVCQSLPEWILGLSIIGGIVSYLALGLFVVFIVKLIKDNIDIELLVLALIFWPIVIIGGIVIGVGSVVASIVYYVGGYLFKLFAMPIVGADKHDLKVLEDNISNKIDTKITKEDNKIMNYLEHDYVPPKPVRAKKEKDKAPAKNKASKKKKAKK